MKKGYAVGTVVALNADSLDFYASEHTNKLFEVKDARLANRAYVYDLGLVGAPAWESASLRGVDGDDLHGVG